MALVVIRSPSKRSRAAATTRADRGGADAAPRRLDGAPEGLRVARVGQQREVGERVADLGALVEAERAEHAVRDPGGGQRGLDRAGGERGAGEHEDLAGRRAGGERVGDQPGGPGGLVAVGARSRAW